MSQSLIVDTLRKCRKAVAGMLLNMEQTSTRQITTAILFVIVSIVNTCGAIFLRSHLLLVKPSFVKPITYDYADDLSSKLHFAGLHFAGLLLPTIYLQSCIYDFILCEAVFCEAVFKVTDLSSKLRITYDYADDLSSKLRIMILFCWVAFL